MYILYVCIMLLDIYFILCNHKKMLLPVITTMPLWKLGHLCTWYTVTYVSNCLSCHKPNALITGWTPCFSDCIYIYIYVCIYEYFVCSGSLMTTYDYMYIVFKPKAKSVGVNIKWKNRFWQNTFQLLPFYDVSFFLFSFFQEQVKACKLWMFHHKIFNCICIQVM